MMNLVKRMNLARPDYRAYNTVPNVLDSFFNGDLFAPMPLLGQLSTERCAPSGIAANVIEKDDAYLIELAAPGLGKDDLSIDLENGKLTVKHIEEDEKETKSPENGYWRKEFARSEFERSFNIDESVINASAIEAKMEKGILTVMLPKRDEAKPKPPKQIEIS
jgi:HSP20 family protein